MKKEKGFTLVELLIVVAIIGILAAIAIPQFNKYKIRGYVAALKSDLKNAHTAGSAYLTDYPNATIFQETQIRRGGWKASPNISTTMATVGAAAGMSLTAGHITLVTGATLNSTNIDYPTNKTVGSGADAYTFTATSTGTSSEGQVNFDGVVFTPLVK